MTEKTMGEIYLEPEEEIIKNAKEIAEESQTAEKNIFRIIYEDDEKSVVLSEIKRLECEILEHSDSKAYVTVKASLAQLAAIKSLNCIEKVEMADEHSDTTTENVTETMITNETVETAFTEHLSLAAMEEQSISTMCYDGDSGSDCDNSNTMQTAYYLPLSSWMNGCICCPGAEIWYKFTPSTTAYYTIYTVGSLDTVGRIYDANSNQLDSNDDDGTGLNFRMVARLTAGQTYYVKVSAYGSNTGYFSIAITNTVFVEYVSIDQGYIALDKGKTKTLTATVSPSYATNKSLRWETEDASVATVNQDGVVTARGAGTTCICAYSQDGSNKSSCCEVSVNVPVESVTINTSSLLMRVGEYDYLYAEVCPTDAVNQLIRWTSTNTAAVWVNEATGRVEARGVGSATIYATAQDGTGVKGSCAVQVQAPIAVQGIDICCDNYTMNVGETAYLSYDIYPADATNKNVTWCSSNPNIAEIDASTGRIIAKLAGTTTITVTTNDGNYVGSCLLTVIIDTVTIQKDGNFNKVVFNKSGKVWRCINNDMIFDENNRNNTFLIRRSNHNFFTYYNENDPFMSNTTPKEYTDDEIKLLYAIDPYGVAHYVQRYASEQFYDNELEGVLGYKDRIFRLLFNREPKYFARTIDGLTWYETTDKSNLSAVQSESESVFGMHPIWDDYTLLQIIEAAATMVDIALTIAFTAPKVVAYLKAHKNAKTIAKIFSFTASSIGSGFISASADEFVEKAFEETSLSWAYDIVSLYSSLNELVSDFDIGGNYYQQVFENCANNLNYNIYVELQDGQKYQLTEISGLIANN